MIFDKSRVEELGFLDGINEVVATTEKEGIINAAPLGVIKDGESISIKLFRGSHTYENILSEGFFVANVIHDPWLFVEAALDDLGEEYFVRIADRLPILENAEAWALFKCRPSRLDIVVVDVEFVKGEILRRDFRAFNRGANLVVEASIAATRFLALRADCYYEEILKLRRIVNRCGGPRDRQAMDRLMERLDSHIHI